MFRNKTLNRKASTEALERSGLNWATPRTQIVHCLFSLALEKGWSSDMALLFAEMMVKRHSS